MGGPPAAAQTAGDGAITATVTARTGAVAPDATAETRWFPFVWSRDVAVIDGDNSELCKTGERRKWNIQQGTSKGNTVIARNPCGHSREKMT